MENLDKVLKALAEYLEARTQEIKGGGATTVATETATEEVKKPTTKKEKEPPVKKEKKEKAEKKEKPMTAKQSETEVLEVTRAYVRVIGKDEAKALIADKFDGKLITQMSHDERMEFMGIMNAQIAEKAEA